MCGEAVDTMYHRAWKCKASEATRLEHGGRELCELAKQHGPEGRMHSLFSRCMAEHPGDSIPKPKAADPYAQSARARGIAYRKFEAEGYEEELGQPVEMRGKIYTDGSCTRSKVAEFQRAGWAAIQPDDEEKVIAVTYGPVPGFMPQTPQAAETPAYAAAVDRLDAPGTIYPDCKNVVDIAALPQAKALRHNRLHAWIWRSIATSVSKAFVTAVEKVKGHVAPSEVEDDPVAHHQAVGK